MRLVKVTVVVSLLLLSFVSYADQRPEQPIVIEPGEDHGGCVECAQSMGEIICGGEPTGAGWSDCEGGWIWLCDGYAGCERVPNCGDRCAIA